MALVDSKKKRLSEGEIIVQAVLDSGATGQAAAVAMSLVVKEMDEPNVYPLAIGNTLFISHANTEKTQVFLRVVNVDTYKNLANNAELFLRRAKDSGVETIVYASPDNAHVSLMKQINELKVAVVQMERSKENGWYVFVIRFPENMKQQQQ